MTSPRPDFLETLRQMAQKPDASAVSQTPRPTPGLLDLLHQLGQHVDARVSSGLPPGTLEGVMPDYIGGPAGAEGAAAKLAAEVPAGQPGMLGALERLVAPQQGPLVQAAKEPLTIRLSGKMHNPYAAEENISKFRELGTTNPLNDAETVVRGPNGLVKFAVEPNPFDPSAIHLKSIESSGRGKGMASSVLRDITGLADNAGVALTLSPKAYGKGGLSDNALREWYARHGFEDARQGMMRRSPRQ